MGQAFYSLKSQMASTSQSTSKTDKCSKLAFHMLLLFLKLNKKELSG